MIGDAGRLRGYPGPARPRVMQPDDFKMLAGNWYGSEYIQQAAPQAIQGVIQGRAPSSPCCVAARRPEARHHEDRGRRCPLRDGDLEGKMTFHESEDRANWVWKWQGTTTDGGAVRSELTKPK